MKAALKNKFQSCFFIFRRTNSVISILPFMNPKRVSGILREIFSGYSLQFANFAVGFRKMPGRKGFFYTLNR